MIIDFELLKSVRLSSHEFVYPSYDWSLTQPNNKQSAMQVIKQGTLL